MTWLDPDSATAWPVFRRGCKVLCSAVNGGLGHGGTGKNAQRYPLPTLLWAHKLKTAGRRLRRKSRYCLGK
jgi:hypothetical protein